MLRAKTAGAAVEHFAEHFSAIAFGHSRAKLETDFAAGSPPWLAPLVDVLAGPCLLRSGRSLHTKYFYGHYVRRINPCRVLNHNSWAA